jgi:hypothetical protein
MVPKLIQFKVTFITSNSLLLSNRAKQNEPVTGLCYQIFTKLGKKIRPLDASNSDYYANTSAKCQVLDGNVQMLSFTNNYVALLFAG